MIKKYTMLFLAFFLLFPYSVGAAAEPTDEIRQIIRDYYVEEVSEATLAKGSAKEITADLDSYSVYMSYEEYKKFSDSVNSKFVGVGITLEENPKGVKILSVIKGGPAERAGLLPGDIITKAGSKNLGGESVQTAISVITGAENTQVSLSILREKTKEVFEKTVRREVIELPNVEYEMLGGNIGYVRLNSFSADAAEKIIPAIRSLTGAKGWIFDVRNNGGGYVSTAQEVMGFFPGVTKGFQLRGKDGVTERYDASVQSTQFTGPTHILINGYSASASEMVSASVKEQKGATLYGQNTYGKGSMQTIFSLSDNSVLKLTVAKFYSPGGTEINKVGVAPDVETEEGQELIVSHRDQLVRGLVGYKKLAKLEKVPVTKTFTVTMSTKMNWAGISESDVQLVQLGGKEAAVRLEVIDDKTIRVIPKEKLQPKGQYLLMIHPKWTGKNTKKMVNGSYLEVTVAE